MCSVDGCEADAKRRGFCVKHHYRWKRHGDPLKTVRIIGDDKARFWSKVDENGPVPAHRPELGPCWVWTGAKNGKGYGVFRLGRERRNAFAHRWAYETFAGEIPDGFVTDHLCRNPSCVRLDHLEPVTGAENMWRGEARAARYRRTGVCDKGHTLADAYRLATGVRACRECSLDKQKRERRDPQSHRHRFNRIPDAKYRKLTESQVTEIRALAATGTVTQRDIASRFGCSQPTVSAIINHRRKRDAEDGVRRVK